MAPGEQEVEPTGRREWISPGLDVLLQTKIRSCPLMLLLQASRKIRRT
jgi:hypothetical protein